MAARTDAQKCDQLKEDLAKCLAESDCIRVHRRTAKECLRDHVEELSPECQQAYHGYVDCKRSLWDMRTRYVARSMG